MPILQELIHFRSACKIKLIYIIRGGVEDTRLDTKTKAKDTKKFRGQGQGPRTQAQVFSKKKGIQKFFQAKKVFKNTFSGDLH